MTFIYILQTYYPVLLFALMVFVCLAIATKRGEGEGQCSRNFKTTDKIDRAINNSNKGIDSSEYAKLLSTNNVQYLAWRACDDVSDQ